MTSATTHCISSIPPPTRTAGSASSRDTTISITSEEKKQGLESVLLSGISFSIVDIKRIKKGNDCLVAY